VLDAVLCTEPKPLRAAETLSIASSIADSEGTAPKLKIAGSIALPVPYRSTVAPSPSGRPRRRSGS